MTTAPTIPDLSGLVLTVDGPVAPETLGTTLMHEQLLVDLRRPAHALRPGEDAPGNTAPLTLDNLAAARRGTPIADNDVCLDVDLAADEAQAFAALGGGTIVDVTGAAMGRDPRGLREIARRTGLQVVMGGGFYTTTFHPLDFASRSIEELAGEIVADIVEGVDGTGIRTGIIGEVGAENTPLVDAEWKSVRASARTSARTGAPLTFHAGGQGAEKLDVIDACLDEGVAPENIVMGHAGGLLFEVDLAERVLAKGVFIEFDFLSSPGSPWGHLVLTSDHRVVAGMAELVRRGHAGQLLLGHDICQKIQLKRYGGLGYDYIPRHFLPALERAGVSSEDIARIMIDNPARALTFHAPVG